MSDYSAFKPRRTKHYGYWPWPQQRPYFKNILRCLLEDLWHRVKWSGLQHKFGWHKCDTSTSFESYHGEILIKYGIRCTLSLIGVVLNLPGYWTLIMRCTWCTGCIHGHLHPRSIASASRHIRVEPGIQFCLSCSEIWLFRHAFCFCWVPNSIATRYNRKMGFPVYF